MALDTAADRRAAAGTAFLGYGITPNAGKDAAWRSQVAWNYSGFGTEETTTTVVVGPAKARRWYIYPNGKKRYQTEREASDTINRLLAQKTRKSKPEAVLKAIEETLAEEPAVLADAGLLRQIDLPSLPNVQFDFAPSLADNAALEMVFLRVRDAQARLEQQRMQVMRRRRDEETLLALLLA